MFKREGTYVWISVWFMLMIDIKEQNSVSNFSSIKK